MLVFTPDMHGRFTWRCFAFAAIVFRFLRSSGRLSILNFCNNSEYPEMLKPFLTRVWFMWNMFQLVYVFLQTELCRMISKSCQQESRRPTMTLWQIIDCQVLLVDICRGSGINFGTRDTTLAMPPPHQTPHLQHGHTCKVGKRLEHRITGADQGVDPGWIRVWIHGGS